MKKYEIKLRSAGVCLHSNKHLKLTKKQKPRNNYIFFIRLTDRIISGYRIAEKLTVNRLTVIRIIQPYCRPLL